MKPAELIKAARKESGLTLREAAEGLGLTHTTLYRYEEDDIHVIPAEILEKMAAFYGMNPQRSLLTESLRAAGERRRVYEECHAELTAECLHELFLRLDERGRKTVLAVLLEELRHSTRR